MGIEFETGRSPKLRGTAVRTTRKVPRREISALHRNPFTFSESMTLTWVAAPWSKLKPESRSPPLNACETRSTSFGVRVERLWISTETSSCGGKVAPTLRAMSRAKSSSVAARAAIGAPNKTKRIRMVRYERLDRSIPFICVLRPAARGTKTNSTRLLTLKEIIAQPFARSANWRQDFAQNVSGKYIECAERTSAPRGHS